MKILHLNYRRKLSEGIKKQLRYEQSAADKLKGIKWDIVAFQINTSQNAFERQLPFFFRSLFLSKLYTWIFLLYHHSRYDFVLMRYAAFDPFVILFGWFVRNRISVHHAKEIEELKLVREDWRGKAASYLARITGFISSRQVKGIVGVTQEIADYQISVHKANCPAGFYPNGIDLSQIDLIEDYRREDIHVVLMCGKFSPWHGLDRLIEAVKIYEASPLSDSGISIHLIGTLDLHQKKIISLLDLKKVKILCHGHMHHQAYNTILSKCDIGLDSLSIDKKNLTEATALKVREYLAIGLPVYSPFKDSAIPEGFPYYRVDLLDLNRIISYAHEMKSVSRSMVRDASASYIQKYNIMKNLSRWLKKI